MVTNVAILILLSFYLLLLQHHRFSTIKYVCLLFITFFSSLITSYFYYITLNITSLSYQPHLFSLFIIFILGDIFQLGFPGISEADCLLTT